MNKGAKLLNSEEEIYTELTNYKNLKSKNLLLKIKSIYNMKLLFSYLKYDNILKLIKNNKSIQNKIGIGKQNYKDYSNIKISSIEIKDPYAGEIKIIKFYPFNDSLSRECERKKFGRHQIAYYLSHYCCILANLLVLIFADFFLLIAIIYYTFYVYGVQKELNHIWVIFINRSLFGLILFRLFYIYYIDNFRNISVYLFFFFTSIHILYEILVTIKYIIISKIKKDDIFMDALFLIFNLAYIIKNLTLISEALRRKKYRIYKLETYKNIPVEPHPIRIEDYRKNKNQYISSISKELKYNYLKYDYYLEEDLEVLEKIHNFRNKNKLKDLRRKDNIPEFIINEISEVILFNWKNIFKLSNNKYLFKCEVGKFND